MTPSPENNPAQRQILVTSALPYANGPIHLGHLVEYIQTDIWVRFQRMRGHHCIYVCADDAHGTPIMLKARAEGIEPEELIERIGHEHRADFARLPRGLRQLPQQPLAGEPPLRGTHLHAPARRRPHRPAHHPPGLRPGSRHVPADRFIKGDLPALRRGGPVRRLLRGLRRHLHAHGPEDPVSAISGATPVERESEHYFFRLGRLRGHAPGVDRLGPPAAGDPQQARRVVRGGLPTGTSPATPPTSASRSRTPRQVLLRLAGCADRLHGELPPLLRPAHGLDFDAWWRPRARRSCYHFIGKDIAYFHTLFWPAMLTAPVSAPPRRVHCHGFLTVNGQKMSKSRGTFIKARTYLDHLNPEYLRYYFAAKLGAGVDDIDLNLEDFVPG
jgi:methionyl-tRNA synthetase